MISESFTALFLSLYNLKSQINYRLLLHDGQPFVIAQNKNKNTFIDYLKIYLCCWLRNSQSIVHLKKFKYSIKLMTSMNILTECSVSKILTFVKKLLAVYTKYPETDLNYNSLSVPKTTTALKLIPNSKN